MIDEIYQAAFEDELEKIGVNWLNLGRAAVHGATQAVAKEGTKNLARNPAVSQVLGKVTKAIDPRLGKSFNEGTIHKLLTSHKARKKLIHQGAGALQNLGAEVSKQRHILGATGQTLLHRGTKALTRISKSMEQQGTGFAKAVRSL